MLLVERNTTLAAAAQGRQLVLAEALIAVSALAMLLAAQWVLSSVIQGTNYYGVDGKMAQSAAIAAFKFAGYFDVTNLSPVQGAGSQLLPKNAWGNPSLWPFAWFAKEKATDVSALIALGIFAVGIYVMMRGFGLSVLPSAIGAQASIALFAPALLIVYTPTNFCLTPGDAVVYAPYMMAFGLLGSLQPGSWRAFAWTAVGISALILYSIYCDPLFTMIAATSWFVPFAVVTLSRFDLKSVVTRGAALACCLVVLVISGAATYLYTLSRYTARVQFAETVDRPRGPEYVSAMTYSANMKYFYLACAVGWVFGLLLLRGRPRTLVAAAAISFTLWVFYSLFYLAWMAKWVPPIPIYIEQCLFALYLAAAVAGYWSLLRWIALLVANAASALAAGTRRLFRSKPHEAEPVAVVVSRPRVWTALRIAAVAVSLVAVAAIPAKVVNYALSPEGQARATIYYEAWSKDPEFVGFMTENVGLEVGKPFRGAINFLTVDHDTGSTMALFWANGIPTLNEYSQLVTPELFYFFHKLSQGNVRGYLNRVPTFWNIGVYSPSYWAAIQMVGIRYVAERWALPDPFNPGLTRSTFPYTPIEAASDQKPGTWYAYELPRPNVGGYSPTEVLVAHSGSDIMAKVSAVEFDPTRQVVLAAQPDQPLVPARDMRLSWIRGGLHVSGRSDGTSLVVLPQQFSRCLRARDSRVRFVRANLALAGMVFSGSVDTDIVFDYGILSPGCRRADLADLGPLDLKIDQRMPHLSADRSISGWSEAMAKFRAAFAAIR